MSVLSEQRIPATVAYEFRDQILTHAENCESHEFVSHPLFGPYGPIDFLMGYYVMRTCFKPLAELRRNKVSEVLDDGFVNLTRPDPMKYIDAWKSVLLLCDCSHGQKAMWDVASAHIREVIRNSQ
jgi:hypothetical protein